jgi:hypothetical protein
MRKMKNHLELNGRENKIHQRKKANMVGICTFDEKDII